MRNSICLLNKTVYLASEYLQSLIKVYFMIAIRLANTQKSELRVLNVVIKVIKSLIRLRYIYSKF